MTQKLYKMLSVRSREGVAHFLEKQTQTLQEEMNILVGLGKKAQKCSLETKEKIARDEDHRGADDTLNIL